MSVTAKEIKELRDRTGAGMMDCRKALIEADGDIEGAIQVLRKSGAAKAAKKAGRIAAEGVVKSSVDAAGNGVIIEVNCETDFVARNQGFQSFVGAVETAVVETSGGEANAAVESQRTELVASIGENIQVRRWALYAPESNRRSFAYVHPGSRLAVLLELNSDGDLQGDAITSFGEDLCFHVAAMDPVCVGEADLPAELIEQEKELALEKHAGKPEHVIENHILPGILKKVVKERCLLNQEAAMGEDKVTNQQLLDSLCKELNQQVRVSRFTRFALGEGIEKKEDNLADEVAKLSGVSA